VEVKRDCALGNVVVGLALAYDGSLPP